MALQVDPCLPQGLDQVLALGALEPGDQAPGRDAADVGHGGELLLPYQVNEDGSITVGLGIDRESVLADGEARPEAVLLAGQSSSRFDLYIDRALFLRSDEITFQIGPFYYLTYEPS